MNYGISGENDETDIEFKNLSTIDQTQTFFLDLEKNWLSVKSQKDSKMVTVILVRQSLRQVIQLFFQYLI